MPEVIQVFGGGLSMHPTQPDQATVLENMLLDSDGIARQRFGLRLIKEFSDLGYLLATCYSPFAQEHRIMVVTASNVMTKEYFGTRSTIAAAGATDISAVIDPSALYGAHRPGKWTVSLPSDPTTANSIIHFAFPHNVSAAPGADLLLGRALAAYRQQDATPTTFKGVPFTHGKHAMVVQSAQNNLRWSAYAAGEQWPVSNYTPLPATIGQGVAGCGLNNNTSYVFGTHGVLRVAGDISTRFVYDELATASAVYPGGHVTRCRDRIFYVAPGPKVVSLGVDFDRIDLPISAQMRNLLNSNTINTWYDDLHDCYCLAGLDITGGLCFMFDLTRKRWQGSFSYDRGNGYSLAMGALGGPAQKSGVTTYPLTYTPFQDQYVLASTNTASRLLVYDQSLTTDQVAGSASQAFALTMWTQGIPGGNPTSDKQCLEIYVDGNGTWDISLATRNTITPDFSTFTTTSVKTGVTLPARIAVPSSVPGYKDARVVLSATSQAGAAIRSVAIKQRELGQGYS